MNKICIFLLIFWSIFSPLCVFYILQKLFFPLKTKDILKNIKEKPIKTRFWNGKINWICFSRGAVLRIRFFSNGILLSFLNKSIWTDYKDITFEENFTSNFMIFIKNNNKYKISVSNDEIDLIKKLKDEE